MGSYQDDENEINGINLHNYIPYQQNFDTILYVHKKVLEQEQAEYEANAKKTKADNKRQEKVNRAPGRHSDRAKYESVFDQTVRFAKNLAPTVIPPNDSTPIFYTIQTSSSPKKREKKVKEIPSANTYQKKKCKKIIETFRVHEKRKHSRKHSSISETASHTFQSNTIDDFNVNQSLSCTLSEQSEKGIKNEVNSKRKRHNKCVISESFEAVAEDLGNADDTRIKVQLMNPAEKNMFCDSIKAPVLDAIRDCILEFNDNEIKEEVRIVKRIVKSNMDKINTILDKLVNIEQYLKDNNNNKKDKYLKGSVIPEKSQASRIEQLGADMEEDKSYEEEFDGCKEHKEGKVDDMGCGEIREVLHMRPSTSVGVKTEKQNRLPARFCWTDANKT